MISNVLKINKLKSRNRWDFSSHDPKYYQILKQIQESKWQHLALGDLVEFFKYGASLPPDYVDKGVLFIRAQNIREYGIDLVDKRFLPSDLPNLDNHRLATGDVLITRSGINVGDAAAVDETIAGSIHGSYSIRLRLNNENVSPKYLAIALNSIALKTQVFAAQGRSAQPNINISELSALQIPLPPRPIQSRVAQVMQDAYATRREQLVEMKKIETSVNEYVLQKLGINWSEIEDVKRFGVSFRFGRIEI